MEDREGKLKTDRLINKVAELGVAHSIVESAEGRVLTIDLADLKASGYSIEDLYEEAKDKDGSITE